MITLRDRVGAGVLALVLAMALLVTCAGCSAGDDEGTPADPAAAPGAAESSAGEQSACFQNQRTIEGAAQQFLAADPAATAVQLARPVDGTHPLVTQGYVAKAPVCPTTGAAYVLGADTRVQACPTHGRY